MSFISYNWIATSQAIEEQGNGNPLQYSCLENPMDGGAWWAAVHGIAKSRIRLSVFTFTFHFHALEKEMATHSSVLAWRIPGTGAPGGLPSMGSHRVRHDWSDLATAAAAASAASATGNWSIISHRFSIVVFFFLLSKSFFFLLLSLKWSHLLSHIVSGCLPKKQPFWWRDEPDFKKRSPKFEP